MDFKANRKGVKNIEAKQQHVNQNSFLFSKWQYPSCRELDERVDSRQDVSSVDVKFIQCQLAEFSIL